MGNQQLGPKAPRRPPKEIEIELLRDLQRRARSSVHDKENETIVQDLLRRFWNSVQGGKKEFVAKGKEWQSMGFQGEDPLTDFRAGGLLALENIVFFVEKYTELATNMIQRREMKMSEDGTFMQNYPWSAAGVNVTHTTMALFGLSTKGKTTDKNDLSQKTKRYWELAIYFSEVYCVAFKLMDNKYSEMKATYLSFNKVLEASREELNDLLKHTGVQDIFKNEQQPLTLFLTERKSGSMSNIEVDLANSQSRSEKVDDEDVDVLGSEGDEAKTTTKSSGRLKPIDHRESRKDTEGKRLRPSETTLAHLLRIQQSVLRGWAVVRQYEGEKAAAAAAGGSGVEDTKDGAGAAKEQDGSAENETGSMPCRVARVLYNFEPKEEGDLRLTEGDTVIITTSDETGWYEGEGKDGEGKFPGNYVEEYKDPYFTALAEYDATTSTELSLKENDIVRLTEVDPSGWWKGIKQKKKGKLKYEEIGEAGWFPAAFVEAVVPPPPTPKSENPPATPGSKKEAPEGKGLSQIDTNADPSDPSWGSKPKTTPLDDSMTADKLKFKIYSNAIGRLEAKEKSDTVDSASVTRQTSTLKISGTPRHDRAGTMAEFGCDGEDE
mmetsp:Transcript_9693/g.23843  ORF Transcript_9693/g.23843 Transcript_9693/m.23843 type:complete len:606 (-) Transcript_9693:194-2011(-)